MQVYFYSMLPKSSFMDQIFSDMDHFQAKIWKFCVIQLKLILKKHNKIIIFQIQRFLQISLCMEGVTVF